MKPFITLASACFALAATGAFADHTTEHCGKSPQADGLHARLATLESQADRIEWTVDKAEQRKLIELNMKHLQEATLQLRRRELSPTCRIELLSAMLEVLLRNQQMALAQAAP